MSNPFWKEEKKKSEEVDVLDLMNSRLVVYNDDYNTFDWVIQCFVEVLKFSSEQSEQLSLIIHHKGKAIVKNDSFEALRMYKNELTDRGLNAVIETD